MGESRKRSGARDEREERAALLRERWASLPERLRHGTQLAGRSAVACGATHHVMERCDFACSCCYLGPEANHTDKLPFEAVCAQLDELRAHLGPGGKAQITAGEVTLLPVGELGRIVAYARAIGLDPMVMTNGQRFDTEPDYLRTLVRHYGLRKVSVHIDSTQRGRRGVPRDLSEAGLNAVRDRFAALVRETRRATRKPLAAASTLTVTGENVGELTPVVRWFLENADAFRILSFQPAAAVGRTRAGERAEGLDDALWRAVETAVGRPLNRHPMHFGHPSCNTTVPLIIGHGPERPVVFEGIRADNGRDSAMFSEAVDRVGPRWHWNGSLAGNLARLSAVCVRHPGFLARAGAYAARRAVAEAPRMVRWVAGALRRGRLPRCRPMLIVVHRFMDAGELDTPLGRERLDACVFKVPVDGRMVSMCEMNARGIREAFDRRMRRERRNPESGPA